MSNTGIMTTEKKSIAATITPEQLLEHWQGHRRLTRKVIEAFPENELFNYSIGGMRPFAEMVFEFIDMAEPGMDGVITAKWQHVDEMLRHSKKKDLHAKDKLLQHWDAVTEEINNRWNEISLRRFQEHDLAFGMWEGPVYGFILYWIDNEIHHRGQGYVYLRSLGIEPPAFWERA
jgi:uncharacterized damage-inducible protein DinB